VKSIRDISIGYKILIPPVIMMAALASVLFIAIQGFDRQGVAIRSVQDIALERTSLLNQFILVSERVQSDLFLVPVLRFMRAPEQEVGTVLDHLERGLSRMGVIYGHILHKWHLDPEEMDLLKQLKIPLHAFIREAGQATDAVSQNPSFGILLVRSAALPFSQFRQLLNQFLAYQEARIAQAENGSKKTVRALKTTTLLISIFTALLAILVTVFIGSRFISRPVRTMTEQMKTLAHGDLSLDMAFRSREDEIGEMGAALEVFRKNAVEKQAAEEALRVSEANYRAIFDTANDAIFIQDLATGRFLDANRKMCEMYGYTVEETRQMDVGGLSEGRAPHDQKEAMAWIQKAAAGTPQIFEWKAKRSNGELFWVEINLKRITLQNQQRLLSIVRDITERKQAEADREKLIQELQDAVASVKQLKGMLPICASCKKIRDDKGYWTQIESYIRDRSNAEFSHGICPECAKKLYPDMDLYGEADSDSVTG